MRDRSYSIEDPAKEILSYLKANQSGCQSLRRRAVIYNADGKWVLQACVVEGISVDRGEVIKEQSRRYPKAVLHEDWLSPKELEDFIEQIMQGKFSLGENFLDAPVNFQRWDKERQPLSNNYMTYAGYVWTSRYQDQVNGMQGELLAPQQPYYPDLHEAVKDWLPFTIYHSNSDSRKGEVILLLPETRAYFADAIPQEGSIALHISGAEADNLKLEVKGAWWNEDGIHHFTEQVSSGLAQLRVPEEAKRLDYVLVDADGTVYDYQQEDGYRHSGLGRNRETNKARTIANLVHKACHSGEGSQIEFKPFIFLENGKLKEIYKTVVAFANAQGGQIFIGINDGCEVEGIDEKLREWAKSEPNEEACKRYLGEIRAKIRNELRGDVQIDFSHAIVDGKMVAVIDVSESKEKPATLLQERTALYIRRGSSNTKTSPEEWMTIISAPNNDVIGWMSKH
jgi:hypothetical protein